MSNIRKLCGFLYLHCECFLVYRSPNIGQEEDVKLQKATREVSKGECVIMDDLTLAIYNGNH